MTARTYSAEDLRAEIESDLEPSSRWGSMIEAGADAMDARDAAETALADIKTSTRNAFVDGAKVGYYKGSGGTAWTSDVEEFEAEAEKRFPHAPWLFRLELDEKEKALAEAKLELDQLRDRYEKDLDKAGDRVAELESCFAMVERERDSWKVIAEEHAQESEAADTLNEALHKRIAELEGESAILASILEEAEELRAARRELDAILDAADRPMMNFGPAMNNPIHGIMNAIGKALARREAARNAAKEAPHETPASNLPA